MVNLERENQMILTLQIKCKLFPENVYGVYLNLFFIVYS